MSLLAAQHGLIFLLWMQVVQGRDNWDYAGVSYTPTHICALKGSTVEMSCTFRSSTYHTVEKNILFTKVSRYQPVDLREDVAYGSRVRYHCKNNKCSLRIRNVSKSDSTSYQCGFITTQQTRSRTYSSGVTLSVTDLQVKDLTGRKYSVSSQLQCQSECELPDHFSYIWYKNGQEIPGESSFLNIVRSTDSYSCAVKGKEGFSSPPVCVSHQQCNKVVYPERFICAVRGASVFISAIYTSNEEFTSKFWFSSGHSHKWVNSSEPEDLWNDPQLAGRVKVFNEEENKLAILMITGLKETDSGRYYFKFKTRSFEWRSNLPGTTLTVADPDLQVTSSSYSSRYYAECSSRCLLPEGVSYVWYKNGIKDKESPSKYTYYYYNEADSVSCAIKRFEAFPSPPVCVNGQSCNRVTYINRRICAVSGSSVDISCRYNSYQNPSRDQTWFRPQGRWEDHSLAEDIRKDLDYANRVDVVETDTGFSTLRISDLRVSDSAEYQFRFKAQKFEWKSILPGTSLTVTDLQVQVAAVTVHSSYTEAKLTCSSRCSQPASLFYVWFKNGKKVENEETLDYQTQFVPGDSISCSLAGHEDHTSPPVYVLSVPSVIVSPHSEIPENSSVSVTCQSGTDSAVEYTWYKNKKTLPKKKNNSLLTFNSIQPSDSGEYYCAVGNELGRKTSKPIFINVTYAPKPPSVSVSPSGAIMEGCSVNLTCSSDANPAASYTWYKENQTLPLGSGSIYHFTSVRSEDRGTYHCRSENQHGQITSSLLVDVQYAPKPPSVDVSGEVMEGRSVTLTCSSDANPEASYTWYKESEDAPIASGPIFTINDIRMQHSQNYFCEARNDLGYLRSTIYLPVHSSWSSTAAGATVAVILMIIFIIVFIWIWKKRSSQQRSEPGGRAAGGEQRNREHEGELYYASIQFSKSRDDCLYSNISPAQPNGDSGEGSRNVIYSAVKYKAGSRTSEGENSEESVALYSTINKIG